MTQLPSSLNPGVHPEGRTQPSTLLIRADATRHIGNGHVMRCLALAAEWQARGGHVVFLTCADNPAITACIDRSGAERIVLPDMHPHPGDLPEMLAILQQRRPAWTVLDGYHFTPCYQEAVWETMQETGGKTLVLDDMGHRSCYHADVLLNPNGYAETLTYPCSGQTIQRLGAQFALLRPEFSRWQTWQRNHPYMARNVLVTLGGTDPENVTLKVIRALSSWRSRDYAIKVVVGPGNPHLAALQQAIAEDGGNMELLIAPDNMGELMAWADMAVAAAGTTALELAFMQVPVLSIVLADNQRRVAAGLTAVGTMQTLGWHDAITHQSLLNAVHNLARNVSMRRAMSIAGKHLVDGKGAQRIVDTMQKPE